MSFLRQEFWNNSVCMYLVAIGIIIVSVLIGLVIRKYGRGRLSISAAKTETKLDDLLAKLLETPLYLFAIVIGVYIAISILRMPDSIQSVLQRILICLITVFVIMAASRLIHEIFALIVLPKIQRTESTIDDQVAILFRKTLVALIWIFGILIVLSNLGYNVVSLLTGLGLGGLAVAMAAKDTLANIIGGITILVDRPIALGDIVKIKDVEGTVAEIGLRTTRVRTWEGHLVSIPNSVAADSVLENISARPALRVRFNLGLNYGTKPSKLLEVEPLIKGAILKANGISKDNEPSVYFLEFGESSLNFQVTYYIEDTGNAFAIRNTVNKGILEAFNKNGLDIPFTTFTVLQKKAAA